MSTETYNFIVHWMSHESDEALYTPYIQEQKEAGNLAPHELESLRDRVRFIRKHGYEEYLKNDPEKIALQIFDGAVKVEERVSGGCNKRG